MYKKHITLHCQKDPVTGIYWVRVEAGVYEGWNANKSVKYTIGRLSFKDCTPKRVTWNCYINDELFDSANTLQGAKALFNEI